MVVTAGKESGEGRKLFQISPIAGLFAAAAVDLRAVNGGGVWRRCVTTDPQFPRASSVVPILFRDLFL